MRTNNSKGIHDANKISPLKQKSRQSNKITTKTNNANTNKVK